MLKKSRIVLLLIVMVWTQIQGSPPHSELEAESHTVWTNASELFIEFSPLVVGTSSTFLAHVTNQKTFKPVTDGTVEISLQDAAGNTLLTTRADAPARRGIFTPSLSPKTAGIYDIVVAIQSKDVTDKITIPGVHVYANSDTAKQAGRTPSGTGTDVSFLKEQAWDIPFKTVRVSEKVVGTTFKTTGELVQNANGWILKVDYPKAYINIEPKIQTIEFKPDYLNTLFSVPNPTADKHHRLVVKSIRTAYLPKFYPVPANSKFVPGSYTDVWVTTSSEAQTEYVIPYSALLEQEGTYYVYVQTAGETFERRALDINAVVGDTVLVTSGLKTGERVVATGVTAIKLSALSGSVPAHSH